MNFLILNYKYNAMKKLMLVGLAIISWSIAAQAQVPTEPNTTRSEERRVGKEC